MNVRDFVNEIDQYINVSVSVHFQGKYMNVRMFVNVKAFLCTIALL